MAFSNIRRKKLKEAKKKIKIGSIFITRYEKARIIGARSLQISLGAPILIAIEPGLKMDSLNIAEAESDQKILPLTIRRTLPSGIYQDVPLTWLISD
jgi:DNA-directed RNA polymerase subunit K/omega